MTVRAYRWFLLALLTLVLFLSSVPLLAAQRHSSVAKPRSAAARSAVTGRKTATKPSAKNARPAVARSSRSVQAQVHPAATHSSKTAATKSKGGTAKPAAKSRTSGAASAASKSSAGKSPRSAASTSGSAKGKGARGSGSRSASRGSRSRGRAVDAGPPRQQSPDSDRIREIQTALAGKGYAIEPTGTWDAQSVEVLKKFQGDHNINNLTGRGKLDSLTLIELGLGPKNESTAALPEAPPTPPSPEGSNP